MQKYIIITLFMLITSTLNAQIKNGTYTLESFETGYNLAVKDGRLYPIDCYGDENFCIWTIKQTGTIKERQVYTLTSLLNGLRLDGDEQELYLHEANDGYYQKWIFDPIPGCTDCYYLTSMATQKRVDGNRSQLYPSDPKESGYQKWRIRPMTPRPGPIKNNPSIVNPGTKIIDKTSPDLTSNVSKESWSAWQAFGLGNYRWRLNVNKSAPNFPEFVQVDFEIQSTISQAKKVIVSVMNCNDPENSSTKYIKELTLGANQLLKYTLTVQNCGTKDQPFVIKPYAIERY